jgi:hypothetical protein
MRKARDTKEEISQYFRGCIGQTFYTPTEHCPFDIVDVTTEVIRCKPHHSKRPEPTNVYIVDMVRIYYWLMSNQEAAPKRAKQITPRLIKNKGSASYLMPLMEDYFKYIQLIDGKITYNPTRMDLMF